MVVNADCPHKSLKECKSEEDYICDNDSMEKNLKTLSRGLAEAVPSSNKRVVHFIHQSVKDFFVENGLSALDGRPKICVSTALIGLATAFVYLDYFTRAPRSLLPSNAFPLSIVLAAISALWLHNSSVKDARADFVIGTAHHQLSRICIRYLAMEETSRSTTRDSDFVMSKFPLLHYAATSWISSHVKQSEERKASQDDLLNYFAWPSEALMQLWVQVYSIVDRYSNDCPPKGTSMVHVASRYQVLGPLRVILQRADQVGIDVDAKDEAGRTRLWWAAGNSHEAVVQLLQTHSSSIIQDGLVELASE